MFKQWSEVSTHPPFPLLQVATSAEVTQFNLLLPCFNLDNYSPQFWLECLNISTNTSKILPTTIKLLLESEDQQWRLVRLIFTGLLPDTEYCLKIAHNLDLDSRWFKTLPKESRPFRFAFSNCLNDETYYIDIQKNIYSQLQREKPDLLILGGDLVYVDSRERWYNIPGGPREKDCLVRYLETWQRLALYRLPYLIPTICIWDDHDYGVNDGDRFFPYKETTLKLHQCFFGSDDIEGVYVNFNQGRIAIFTHQSQKFLLLDNRYFRLHDDLTIYPNLTEINELDYHSLYQYFIKQQTEQRYNLFGQLQEDWLISQINNSESEFIWLVGGNQFFGNHHGKESYSRSNPEQFYHFLERVKVVGKPFAILSGDIHLSEFCRYPVYGEKEKPVYEFGISPLHSTMKLTDCQGDCYEKFTNPYRIKPDLLREQNHELEIERLEKLATYGLVAFRYNFGVFTTKFVDNRYLDLRVKVVADNRNLLFNFATELD